MAETGGAPEGEGVRVFAVKLIDQSGVEYALELRVLKDDLQRLAQRLLRAPDGVVTFAEGTVRGIIRRTGTVYEVDSPLAVARPRYREATKEE
jgi:hypothetical protein